jgi:hypothetical protein
METMMSHFIKVDRQVDTVLIEIDADLAEKVCVVLGRVFDNTRTNTIASTDDLWEELRKVTRRGKSIYTTNPTSASFDIVNRD